MSNKTPPPRRFEDYVLTRASGPDCGLSNVPEEKLALSLGDASIRYQFDGTSDIVPIGFDFGFDGTTYTGIVVNNNGWMALADPVATTNTQVTGSLLLSGNMDNQGINPTITSKSVLLAPWFDLLRNAGDGEVSDFLLSLFGINAYRTKYGYDVPTSLYNPAHSGVKIYRDQNDVHGRRTIVRWHSMSSQGNNPDSVFSYESVLYENGDIEFRYAPKQQITAETVVTDGSGHSAFQTSATIGIFASGSNRFRDFTNFVRKDDRQTYRYGGAIYDPSFSDTGYVVDYTDPFEYVSRKYAWTLRSANWPSQRGLETIFKFSPPKNRKKILPKLAVSVPSNRLSGPEIRRGVEPDTLLHKDVVYDDRRSIPYGTTAVVNYPTLLHRFAGGYEPNTALRQNIFGSSFNELEVTASIGKEPSQQQLTDQQPDNHASAFVENNLFDQVRTTDSFFSSSADENAGTNSMLQSKSQISISLPVNQTTTLFQTSASIYYYNHRYGSWLLPRNATTATDSDVAKADDYVKNHRVTEDHRGFGPIGNTVTSGSSAPTGITGTDIVFNSPFVLSNAAAVMSKDYSKSVSRNPLYEPTNDETFVVQVQQPFVIEKAVIDIPFEFGSGWFSDYTTSTMPVNSSGSFDFAGPALTVALFNALGTGPTSKRDLILTGTITHNNDIISSDILVTSFAPDSMDVVIRPIGFLHYSSVPGAIVTPKTGGSFGTFTGSVTVKAEAAISNGVVLQYAQDMIDIVANPDDITNIHTFFTQPNLLLVSSSIPTSGGINYAYVDSFGRAQTGFEQSGRSVFGKEYGSFQGIIKNGRIPNPFYLTGGLLLSTNNDVDKRVIEGSTNFFIRTAIPLEVHHRSPYVIMPGDKLLLTVSKSRPICYATGSGGTAKFAGSHDLKLRSGSINMTLYGSYLKQSVAIDDPPKQVLASNSVRETLASQPVLDQYDVFCRDEFVGGMYDDYMTGSMVKQTSALGAILLVTGSRGRVFSKNSARTQPTPDTSTAELRANPFKAFRLQPWFERVGTIGTNVATDYSERYFDSLMPAIDKCFAADGTSIAIYASSSLLDPKFQLPIAIVLANSPTGSQVFETAWSSAFPFEPRYGSVTRLEDISKAFISKFTVQPDLTTITAIDPINLPGFFYASYGNTPASNAALIAFSDVNIGQGVNGSGFFVTGSCVVDDMARVLYGFGDSYDSSVIPSVGRIGNNHMPTWRQIAPASSASNDLFMAFGPIIRGWKYGVHNGLASYNRAHFRRDRFGQFRDMLEQRALVKSYNAGTTTRGVVNVRFVNTSGSTVDPLLTSSQNLSFEATSSFPYFDGTTKNR